MLFNKKQSGLRSVGCLPAAVVGLFLAFSPLSANAAGLFGQIEFKANRIDSIPKWVDVIGRTKTEWPLLQACLDNEAACISKNLVKWRTFMVREMGQGTSRRQLKAVNDFFNSYRYITDDRLLGMSDYWQTPGQFIERSGDCEDYSIAKFYTLKALGWSQDNMRLIVLHDSVRNIAHAVLGVKYAAEEYILDNLSTEPLPQQNVLQYAPYYAVNETTRWVFIAPNP